MRSVGTRIQSAGHCRRQQGIRLFPFCLYDNHAAQVAPLAGLERRDADGARPFAGPFYRRDGQRNARQHVIEAEAGRRGCDRCRYPAR